MKGKPNFLVAEKAEEQISFLKYATWGLLERWSNKIEFWRKNQQDWFELYFSSSICLLGRIFQKFAERIITEWAIDKWLDLILLIKDAHLA